MKIYSMTATFGKLEHATLTLQPGLNIIQAPNEWGKSTWCAFLVAMLYGIETRVHTTKTALADKERYAPWSGSPMSGRIDLCWNGRNITIERSSKGRSVFGVFRAYETDTGLEIPELTAANCGEMLLGVEKSVFTRAGFLRLSDLPVTQDENLRSRLNALVTTGDESGTADTLFQKLKDLKNRCRLNRSTGLLPQAEAQKQDLEEKLEELHQLQEQCTKIKERQAQLEVFHKQLDNHQTALEYAASRTYSEKLATAENTYSAVSQRVTELEQTCGALPEAADIERTLTQLRQLRDSRDAVHMELQMQPPLPQAPEIPSVFRGLSPKDAARQAKTDADVYAVSSAEQSKRALGILGVVGAIVGIGLLFLPNWIARGIGMALILAGILLYSGNRAARNRAAATLGALTQKYAPLPPEQWVAAAEGGANAQAEYAAAKNARDLLLSDLSSRMTAINQQIDTLTGGIPLAQFEQQQKSALDDRKALEEALREQNRAADLVQALRSSHSQAPAPAFADTMTYDAPETARLLSDCTFEQRQLQHKLGHCQGRMEALGHEDTLSQQLDDINSRIQKLEHTYAALTLAQDTLASAKSELQRRFAPRISRRAQELFAALTGGRYDRLTLDEDLAVHAGAQNEDTLHSSLWRSEGTVDQLYLALRLAVAEELTPEAPLILDDALVRFDDTRLQAAMDILRQAADSKQVILFTCQSREDHFNTTGALL